MKYFLLTYDAGEDFQETRTAYRPAHLELAKAAQARGELLFAGALGEPTRGSALVFRAESAERVEAFAKTDPYVTSGLVTYRVREWMISIGADFMPADSGRTLSSTPPSQHLVLGSSGNPD